MRGTDLRHALRETFLKASAASGSWAWCRGRAESLRKAERPQLPAYRRLADRHPERLPEPLREVDPPPAHHPVAPGLRTGLHHPRQRRPLHRRQRRRLARRLAVDQPGRTFRVEAQHPVPDDLQPDTADPRCLGPRPALRDHRQCQQPTHLLCVPTVPRQPAQIVAAQIIPKPDCRRHGKPPLVFRGESRQRAHGNPHVSQKLRPLVSA